MKPLSNDFLTRDECTAMKGLAIFCIMIHNFCHFLTGPMQENEYDFALSNGQLFLEHMLHPTSLLPIYVFTLIDIGVYVFTFLSGYGLVKKYEKPGVEVKLMGFIGYRYLKLLRLMLLPLLAFHLLYMFYNNWGMATSWQNIVAQLLTVVNITAFPNPAKAILPGPYWFFGMIMEMYVIYRLVLYRPASSSRASRVWPVVAMIVVCLVAELLCDPHGTMIHYLRYNFVYGALPFGLGVLAARFAGEWRLSRWWWAAICLVAAVLTVAANYNFYLWLLISLMVVAFVLTLIKLCRGKALKPLVWMGNLSAMLFVVHPVLRMLFCRDSTRVLEAGVYVYLVPYMVASFVAAIVYRYLLKWLPDVKIKATRPQSDANILPDGDK